MEKVVAFIALIWIVETIYFTYIAVKGGYPAHFGIATSTVIVTVSSAMVYLSVIAWR